MQLILRTLNDAQSCFAAVHFKRGEDGGSLRLQRRNEVHFFGRIFPSDVIKPPARRLRSATCPHLCCAHALFRAMPNRFATEFFDEFIEPEADETTGERSVKCKFVAKVRGESVAVYCLQCAWSRVLYQRASEASDESSLAICPRAVRQSCGTFETINAMSFLRACCTDCAQRVRLSRLGPHDAPLLCGRRRNALYRRPVQVQAR